MQLGFISRTPRGRCATELAYKHLGLVRDGQQRLD
jgi:Holliday junction DNA helicase RuvB